MIADSIRRWARLRPDAIALDWNARSLSYHEFWGEIDRARRRFAADALPAHGTAVVALPGLLDAWIAVLALRSIGLDTLSVPSLAFAVDLGIRDLACVIVGEGQAHDERLHGLRLSGVRLIRISREQASNGAPSAPCDVTASPGRHLLLTSGTTGTRKRVALDNATEDERNASWARSFGFDRHSVFFAADFPLFTGVGYLKPAAAWCVGGRVVAEQRRNRYLNLFARPCTLVILVPSKVRELLDGVAEDVVPRPGLELLVAGGFLPLQLATAARQVADSVGVYYASSEIAAITLRSRFATLDDLIWMTPTGERELEVVDDRGRACPAGHEGELRIRTTALDTERYVDDAGASAAVFRDGWFHPGDMAMRRADGRIRILGRTAHVLNVGGLKVAVAPIEQRVQAYLGVDEVCVFSGLDAAGSEELVVAVRSARAIPQPRLDGVAARLGAFPCVRFAVLPEFPCVESGLHKTDRRRLRRMLLRD